MFTNNQRNELMHRRWVAPLKSVQEDDWQQVWVTPASLKIMVEWQLQTYANHGETHLTQIRNTVAVQK